MDAAPSPSGGRLNGWKEIAAHFGRTARTVQRWERELGLPVHRLATGKGETVFALVEELGRWLADNERAEATDTGAGASAATPAPSVLASSSPPPARRGARRAALVVAAVAVALAVLVGWRGWPGAARGVPTDYTREGRELTVLGQSGEVLWRWRTPFEPNEVVYEQERLIGAEPVHFADLDGDGHTEVVFHALGVKFEDGGVFVFEDGGELRFAWKYEGRKRFGDQTYAPPWVVRRVTVRKPAAGRPEIWVTIQHAPWFPSAAIRLDAAGKVTGEFWNPGYIRTVVPARLGGREVLLVGAGNNEFRSATLAVVDPDIPATAPAIKADYRCADCPPAGPLRYLLFPRLLLAREFDVVSSTFLVTVDAAGQIVVTIDHLGVGIEPDPSTASRAAVHYILDPTIGLLSAELGDSYVQAYRRLAAEGRFTRPIDRDDQSELWPVREWNGSAFAPLPVPGEKR